MARDYQPFIIRIDEQLRDDFPVQADFLGATWTGTIPRALPLLNIQEIEQAKLWLERGFIDRDYAKDFGRRLFRTLFQDAIREGFRIAYERVAKKDDGLRVVLILPQALVDLPWELMYDDDGGHGFLARSTTAPLVRHYEVTTLPHTAPEKGPLRILLVSASPPDYPPISSEQESQKIRESLSRRGIGIFQALRLLGRQLSHTHSLSHFFQRIRNRNLFEIDTLPNATKGSLQRKIVEAQRNGESFHVVHFIGHGYVDGSGSYLVFESEENKAELVASDEFAEMLGEPTINLAVLNACQTASATRFFQSIAQATLQRGVPTVIGMQVPILDRTALGFAEEFYGAWASGQPIESALAYARRLTKEETPGAAADWSIPVLFMRPIEGIKLDLAPQPIHVPTVVRSLRWIIGGFLSLLATIGLLFTIPDVNQQLRTEVPIIRCVFPYPMESGFNVVVNEFTVVDDAGSVLRSKDGRAVAEYAYQQLNFNMGELNLGGPHHVRPPKHTCLIKGNTREEREAAAAALAEQVNADVIVYGVITGTVGPASFSPEFYVNYKGFEEGDEITGQHELGEAVSVILPFDRTKFIPADNPALSARSEVLSLLTIGLSYYSVDNFDEASKYFLQSRNTKGWSDNAGKEVIYLLLGNATSRLVSQKKSIELLDRSLTYFDTALLINDAYARALVGKAGVLYLMSLGDPNNEDFASIDLAKLAEATALYKRARDLGNPPKSANIEIKVHFGLGQIDLARCLHAQVIAGDWKTPLSEAESEFLAVIKEFDNGNVRIANLAGHSYARLGLIARIQKNTEKAIVLYTRAIELVTPFYQSYYSTLLGEIYVETCQIDLALKAYQEAILIAEFYGYEDEASQYRQRLEVIQNVQCQPGSRQ